VCAEDARLPPAPRADPFADEADAPEEDNEGVVKGKTYVHVRVQQRNGRKSLTTVQARAPVCFWPLAHARRCTHPCPRTPGARRDTRAVHANACARRLAPRRSPHAHAHAHARARARAAAHAQP
jgi:hypothetical protein